MKLYCKEKKGRWVVVKAALPQIKVLQKTGSFVFTHIQYLSKTWLYYKHKHMNLKGVTAVEVCES